MIYPNDANGETLRRMQAQGDDLTRPRSIDFTVVFTDENSARQFSERLQGLTYEASLELTETAKDFPWDVVIVKNMTPSHKEICEFERLLQGIADSFNGHNDGWGCFSEPS